MQNNPATSNNHVKSAFLRWVLMCGGWLCIVAGIVGIFLPLLPTVPFLLLAAACFARSSGRFHAWLVEHDHLGPLIRDYLNGGGIPLRAKRVALCMIWVSFPVSSIFFVRILWVRIMLMSIAVAVTWYLLRLPTVTGSENGGNGEGHGRQ